MCIHVIFASRYPKPRKIETLLGPRANCFAPTTTSNFEATTTASYLLLHLLILLSPLLH